MKNPTENAALRNISIEQRGVQFENDITFSLLTALTKLDTSSRKGTKIEDTQRGTDFVSLGIPIDVSINPRKQGKTDSIKDAQITYLTHRRLTKAVPLTYKIRYGNNYKKKNIAQTFAIPTLVLEFNINEIHGNNYNNFAVTTYIPPPELTETLTLKKIPDDHQILEKSVLDDLWPGIIEQGIEYYKKHTGYDHVNDIEHREAELQRALDKDIKAGIENPIMANFYDIPDCTGENTENITYEPEV